MTALFDVFWRSYPVKRNKGDARKAWLQIKADSMVEMLIADIKNRVHQDEQWQRGFIPYPATYLRNERWEDELVSRYTHAKPRTNEQWEQYGKENGMQAKPGETFQHYIGRLKAIA